MTETTVAPRTNLTRATAGMSAVTLVSRLTGFVRVWVVLNVLGSTLLNDVYQSANYVPNILYELLAAGALQAVLVPQIVAELKHDDRRKADQLASSVLVHGSVILGVVAAIGIVLAPQIMAVSLGGISEPIARQRAITLGSQFLWLFLPQVVLYLINAVATALLNARDRFLLPAAAPLLNNIVVIATYLVFAAMRGDQEPNLLLTGPEKWVLAGGTTLGVVVFCVAVGAGAWADGFRPRRPLSPRPGAGALRAPVDVGNRLPGPPTAARARRDQAVVRRSRQLHHLADRLAGLSASPYRPGGSDPHDEVSHDVPSGAGGRPPGVLRVGGRRGEGDRHRLAGLRGVFGGGRPAGGARHRHQRPGRRP